MSKTERIGERSQDIRSTIKRIAYTKLHCGCWGVRSEGYEVNLTGDILPVSLRSGESKLEKVGKVVWRGRMDRKDIGLYHISGQMECK